VNPRYRIYAALGLGGVLLIIGTFTLLGRGSSTPAAAPVIRPHHRLRHVATTKAAKAKKAVPAAKRRRHVRPKAKAKTPLAPPKVAKTNGATDGMPSELSAALAGHSVVIVSLVVPDAPVDEMAYAEAKAGAAQAGAGFVRIDASNNDDVQALSTLVNTSADPGNRLLDSPATLVFRQPHDLYVRMNGYVDADTIAQAAANAAPIATVTSTSAGADTAWIAGANAFCTKVKLELASKSLPTSSTDLLSYLQSFIGTLKSGIDKIRGLKPPAGKAARVQAMLDAYDRTFADANAALAAAKRKDAATFQRLAAKIDREGVEADAIAAELGATACAGGDR
jgi:hypothetical protein